MKRFFIVVLGLGMAGYVFFAGWLSFWTHPGEHTVFVAKTSGVYDRAASGSDFVWSLEGLLPTNVQAVGFPAQVWNETFRLTGALPLSVFLSRFLGVTEDLFEYDVRVDLELGWDPQALPRLVREHALTRQTVEGYRTLRRASLEQRIRAWVLGASAELEALDRLIRLSPSEMARDFAETYPDAAEGLRIQKIFLQTIRRPDFDLYRKTASTANELHVLVLERQQNRALERRLVSIREEEKRELLSRYGELFEKYPRLVDLLGSAAWPQLGSVLPSLSPAESRR